MIFRWQVGREGASEPEPAQKAVLVLVPFFWGGVYDLFFSNFLFDLRRISVGVFSELKISKSEDHLVKPGKLGPL